MLDKCQVPFSRTDCKLVNTLKKSTKGICGRPKRKAKTDKGSIYLTRDLFSFEKDQFGKTRLQIGGRKYNIGY